MAKKKIKIVVDLIVSFDADKTTAEQFVEDLQFKIPRTYVSDAMVSTKVAVVDSITSSFTPVDPA